ncbi:MAG: helix-turn-helix domain-containing protein [Deltaproteobacteria bacterium]|nr:helix-turn-helix domain-containing protein [Deltaproteobacteria bacterium]
MTELCERYGVSRPTGYKWLQRADEGTPGFVDRSRAPARCPHRTPASVERQILKLRDQYGWAAKKLIQVLERRHPETAWPARSTVNAIQDRHGSMTATFRERFREADSRERRGLFRLEERELLLSNALACEHIRLEPVDDGPGASSTTGRCPEESTSALARSPVPGCKPSARTFVNDQPDRSPDRAAHEGSPRRLRGACAGRRPGAAKGDRDPFPSQPNGGLFGCRDFESAEGRFLFRPWGEGRMVS